MRVVPYLGIAVAVAVGIAVAPYIWWLLFATVVFLAACVCAAVIRRAWWRVTASVQRAAALRDG
jgi:hypothetical protein